MTECQYFVLPYSVSNFLFLISFKISSLSTNEKMKGVIELQLIFKNCPHYWATDGRRYRIFLFILWYFQILDNSRK